MVSIRTIYFVPYDQDHALFLLIFVLDVQLTMIDEDDALSQQ